ncbi:MAG TPA: hypothetical protein PL126_03995 [Candidatus Cloacimonadota bacterium]|nr:hypothetical protein [Candidatus Cloacimonadota bacterium]
MKVKFKYGIRTYSGTVDEMTYGSYRKGRLCIGRQYVIPKATIQNEKMGNAAKNLALLWKSASDEFRADYKIYAGLYATYVSKANEMPPTCYALFTKAMHNWAKGEDPALDLADVQVEDITTLGAGISSIANCVNHNHLPAVPGYNNLNNSY